MISIFYTQDFQLVGEKGKRDEAEENSIIKTMWPNVPCKYMRIMNRRDELLH